MSFIEAVRSMNGTPNAPAQPSAPRTGQGPTLGYHANAVRDECANVRNAGVGNRNRTLNEAAFNLAQVMDPGMWENELTQAALVSGLPLSEIRQTIASGVKGAAAKPRPAHRMPSGRPSGPVQDLPELGGYEEVEGPSPWRHVDPEQAKQDQEHPPAYLAREDGTYLFYPGKVNGLIGESESGKTWVALLAVQQALDAGHAVLYLDFEDTYSGITGRLTSMGADLGRFYYTAPDVGLSAIHRAALMDDLAQIQPELIILDGFNAAMTLLGLDLNSNTDATRFAQELLRPLSKTGAAVAYVDHLPKNREGQFKGGIGAQAKRAMTTGCAIRVDVEQEFGKGQTGRLKLTVDKDRPGLVRAIAGGGKHLGHAVLVSSHLGDAVSMSIDPAGGSQPTVLMGKVLEYLAVVGDASKNQIRREVIGDDKAIDRAITALAEEGKVTLAQGPRRAIIVTSVTSVDFGAPKSVTSVPPLEGTEHRSEDRGEPSTELRWDQR